MPHVFGHGSNLKLVGMAGFPPASIDVEAQGSMYLSYGSEMAAQAGLAPAPVRLTGGWTTVIPPGNKLVTVAGLAPAVTWSQARHVAATLHGVRPASSDGREPMAVSAIRRGGVVVRWMTERVP